MSSMIRPLLRVLIVDPDSRVRRGLRALLETQADMVVVGEATSAVGAGQHADKLKPSVVLLDLVLPTVPEGLATLQLLTARGHMCLATSWNGGLREAALEMGAGGFIEKGGSPESLLAAIRSMSRAPERVQPGLHH